MASTIDSPETLPRLTGRVPVTSSFWRDGNFRSMIASTGWLLSLVFGPVARPPPLPCPPNDGRNKYPGCADYCFARLTEPDARLMDFFIPSSRTIDIHACTYMYIDAALMCGDDEQKFRPSVIISEWWIPLFQTSLDASMKNLLLDNNNNKS